VWRAIWFYILWKASHSNMDTRVCVLRKGLVNSVDGHLSMLVPRSTICNTQDHIITSLPWQAVSGSSSVSCSVTWRRAGRQWCGCNKTCSQHHCQGEAGWEMVPIPYMPCSAICHRAGADPREGSESLSCCHLDRPHWGMLSLCTPFRPQSTASLTHLCSSANIFAFTKDFLFPELMYTPLRAFSRVLSTLNPIELEHLADT